MISHHDHPRPARRVQRAAIAAACGIVAVESLVPSAVHAGAGSETVHFQCDPSGAPFQWTVPEGVRTFRVEVAGGAGGDAPGAGGTGGHGAAIEATLDTTQGSNTRIRGWVGCAGEARNATRAAGGLGGQSAIGRAANGGSGTILELLQGAGGTVTETLIIAGGGGGGGMPGSGFGPDIGGSGGAAGDAVLGAGAGPGQPGDGGWLGGGAGGLTDCGPTLGQPGQDAAVPGAGGGGGGGGGFRGGCGGGAGTAATISLFSRLGSGGGGAGGSSRVDGTASQISIWPGSNSDGYVDITYTIGQ